MVNAPHSSQDVFVVPLTSNLISLLAGEFVLTDWAAAGLLHYVISGLSWWRPPGARDHLGAVSGEDGKRRDRDADPSIGIGRRNLS